MGIFSGQHRLFVVALIAQLKIGAFADLGFLFRAMRVVASHAFSFGNRVVLKVSGSADVLVTCHAQCFLGSRELEFMIGAREGKVTYRALSYFKRAMKIFVLDDLRMAFT